LAARALIEGAGYRRTASRHPGAFARSGRRRLSPRRPVWESPDFFNMSGCRDLCFHVQEHRLTIPQLQGVHRRKQPDVPRVRDRSEQAA